MASKKVFSGNGWSFESAGRPGPEAAVSLPPEKQKVRITLEKRPKGKEVTVVSGFSLGGADRKKLAATLKKSCGSGGSDAEDKIEIQGDHRQALAKILAVLGWSVK